MKMRTQQQYNNQDRYVNELAVPRRHFYFGSSWLFFYLFVCGMLALWPPLKLSTLLFVMLYIIIKTRK